MLHRVAQLRNTPPALKSSLIDRILKGYPDSTTARNIERSKHRTESIGKPFELAFQDLGSGKAISVQKDLRGKVVVVEFWATWCGPCVAELLKLKELYAKYRDRGVEFIGISLDPADEKGRKAVESFIETMKVDWPQFHGDGASSEFAESWGIRLIPWAFIIDTEGKLHSIEARGRLEALIAELLEAGAASDVKGAKPRL